MTIKDGIGQEVRAPVVVGYINERMLSILRSGMTPCTTISPVKTEYAQVAIYIEVTK